MLQLYQTLSVFLCGVLAVHVAEAGTLLIDINILILWQKQHFVYSKSNNLNIDSGEIGFFVLNK